MQRNARVWRIVVVTVLVASIGASGGSAGAQSAAEPASVVATNIAPDPYRTVADWAKLPAGRPWGSAAGVAIDRHDNIWVAERCGANSCAGSNLAPILEFDQAGNLLRSFGAGLFVFPHGIAVDRDDNVWVTDGMDKDGKGQQVWKFSPDGKVLMTLGKAGVAGTTDDTFNAPSAVAIAPNGDIFIADGHGGDTNARIVKFSKDGTFIKTWGKKGTGPGEFDVPHCAVFDAQGRLLICDRNNNRIQMFDQNGTYIAEWRQYSRPSGIALRGDTIYVADSESESVSKNHYGWKRGIRTGNLKDGRVTAFLPDPVDVATSTSGAEGIAVDAKGQIYGAEVAQKDIKRYVFDPKTPPIPHFTVDTSWPKPLPNNWVIGQIGGIFVDATDHVWVFQRPRSLTEDERGATLTPPRSVCCVPAPPVIEFDQAGNVVQAWGGPHAGYDWPNSEHGISVDTKGNVWLAGSGKGDGTILEFKRDGTFVKQIGHPGPIDSSDTTHLGQPADMWIDEPAHEIYVADGYGNHRVIVFDTESGAFKRMWGAYGKPPRDDGPAKYDPNAPISTSFQNPVHCVRIANDGLVYVCDRINDRVQVFHKDGTYVREFREFARTLGNGSMWSINFYPPKEQTYLLIADGENDQVRVVRRDNDAMVASFGRSGRNAGDFHWVHVMSVDSRGNIYTGEVDTAKRIQKFRPD